MMIDSGVQAKDLDLILVATATPDYVGFPSTAAIVQRDERYVIDQGLCIKCDACRELAPDAVQVVDALATSD